MRNQIREAESEAVVKTKVSVTIDQKLVEWIDKLIEKGLFRNRSHIIEEALKFMKKEGVKKILLEKLEGSEKGTL
jgi:Arc/MetJ-type ribon-helix-helix transcriptional regulator